ncbi:hypothetical protein ATK86_7108 [Nocardia fluminea]|uniref:DUF8176 domain-containing protein n=1 Tax=Nocardia fluminea TaxID=134984 RepID=A0A2N3V500_9NOCA|nr:hypothetical protein ATK86_7108 [Nocardia fluminea]
MLVGLATLAVVAAVIAPNGSAQPTASACEETSQADVVTGSGPGDTTTGPTSILGFNHAYYVNRSAELTRRFLTSDSAITTGDRLQTGIDAVPTDTRHCVSIAPLNVNGESALWTVTVTEYRPGTEPWIARQTVTTRTSDRVTLISEITAS